MIAEKNRKNPESWMAWILLAALLLSLVPLVILGLYAAPANDDYSFSADSHLRYEETGRMADAVQEAWKQARSSYYNWQGTFSAIFLMALQPAVFYFALYRITAPLMLTAFLGGTFFLCYVLFTEVFRESKQLAVCVASLVSLVGLQLMPSPAEGLYWFNGAVYYTFFYGLSLLAIAGIIRVLERGGWGRTVLLCLLGVFLGGGNYMTALCYAIAGAGILLLAGLWKNRHFWMSLLPYLVFLASFAANAMAPGNAVRKLGMQLFEHPMGPIAAVLASFQAGFQYGVQWFRLPVLAMLLVLAGLLLERPERSTEHRSFSFRFPALVTICSFCLFSALFCPSFFSIGNEGPLRLMNAIWFSYVLLLALNLYYWLSWAEERHRRKQQSVTGHSSGRTFNWPVVGLVMGLLCCGIYLRTGAYSSIAALGALRSGEAQAYYAAAEERLTVLEDPEIIDAELDPYPCTPFMLYTGDISSNRLYFVNEDMARFYGKKSVIRKDAG